MAIRIGDLLKEAGIVSEAMINYALNVQKITGTRLGDTLKQLKFITDADVAMVLAKQTDLQYNDLQGVAPDPDLLIKVPHDTAIKYEALPLGDSEGRITIAVADPFDEKLKIRMSQLFDIPIQYTVAPQSTLNRTIEYVYYLNKHPIAEEIRELIEAGKNGQDVQIEKLHELIIRTGIDHRASDIHISATELASLVSYRIDGVLQLVYSLPSTLHNRLVSIIKVNSEMDVAERNRPQDGRISYEFLQDKFDLRVSTIPTAHGENVVMRILASATQIRSLEELGFNEAQLNKVSRMVAAPYGMILSVGPTGSGKSTSLYAMVRRINLMEKNLMTIEDPVEYDLPLVKQVAVNEKAGVTFSSAIRGFLRQDPDAILIGEIRDEETSQLAIRAAQTGHLVLSTVHANDAIGAISRLKDLGIGSFLLSSSLTGIIAQRLARRLCDHCKEPYQVSEEEKELFGFGVDSVYQHKGCDICRKTGYIGRTAIAEIVEIDDKLRALVDENASQLAIKKEAFQGDTKTLIQAGIELIEQGKTDIKEFRRVIKTDELILAMQQRKEQAKQVAQENVSVKKQNSIDNANLDEEAEATSTESTQTTPEKKKTTRRRRKKTTAKSKSQTATSVEE